MSPIKVLIKRILRVILRVKSDRNRVPLMSTNKIYFTLKLLQFEDTLNYFLCKFVRTALYFDVNLFNKYYINLLPNHEYETRRWNLILPPARTDLDKRSHIFKSIAVFNALPDYLRVEMSHFKFKKLYKNFILEQYADRN